MTRVRKKLENLREEPAYTLAEAAEYLQLPRATLRSWVVGQDYPTKSGKRRFQPVIVPASRKPLLLSFVNLVEAHVLAAIRRQHDVQLSKVRRAVAFLKKKLNAQRPLAERKFRTDGIDLFVEHAGLVISASEEGQATFHGLLDLYLRRIVHDRRGLPVKLYPFTRNREFCVEPLDEPKVVVIDPSMASGRPVIAGTGIPVSILAERYKAGESIDDLVKDYGRERLEIEEALRSVCAA